ncbi:MAG: tetrahydromethanopterin S-methyltransferase subunit H [Nitrososphaerota archaeon]|nr:tetrahydromethanopterin S-methyltransferase subunit H [Candidatus Bathyarchaeota archaeon]MDW8022707.1 tetrahydromethanopterin S-methyltransferase subunit H [Nitrososphaerota archaeon]
MFKFEKEQKVFNIAGVNVGGQPGEYPTVLIGSIFYSGHKIVSDHVNGVFDKKQAEALINRVEELSDKTGNPFILDVVGETPEALIKYIDFVGNLTKCPFLVDGAAAKIRIPAMKHAVEVGLNERALYNSIDFNVTDDEIKFLKECGVQNAVLMAFNPKKPWAEGRIDALKGEAGRKGLLQAAEEAGVKNLLVDTAVLDMPGISISARAIYLVKNEFGLPSGCGPANAVTTWKRVKKGEFGPHAYEVCAGGSGIMTQMMGANFVLYGPVELSDAAFISCAMTDALVAYAARRLGITTKTKNHPLFKIF